MSSKKDPFSDLVGYQGSLSPVIKQAKAAIMYPPMGLHTLILGETGVGKSDLAGLMFRFAKEENLLDEKAEFIVFNCADYAENPELLMSHLFGYKKGAFTGADVDKEGLVERANNSILFLDEIHRLPPEGQEQLFYLIDKGKFRRLGETSHERSVNLTIIAATTENSELTLLSTFRRRIPMVIEILPLKDRPLEERFSLIKYFFYRESIRIEKQIVVENEAIKALLLFDCPGNLGQLKSEIQVACAKSFLNMIVDESDYLRISLKVLSKNVKQGLFQIKHFRQVIERMIGRGEIVINNKINKNSNAENTKFNLLDDIYSYIERRYGELLLKYENQDIVNNIIGSEVDNQLKKFVEKIEKNKSKLSMKELVGIYGVEIVEIVEKIKKMVKTLYHLNIDSLYYVLIAHLNAAVERIRRGKSIKNPKITSIREKYPREFMVAMDILGLIEIETGLNMPIDEAGFITMYLNMIVRDSYTIEDRKVGVIVISHGSVASGMVAVANKVLGIDHGRYIEMAMNEKHESALERTIDLVKKIDQGKGVLLLADMGSLTTFGDMVTETTGIPTRTLDRTDTITVIEALRRAILNDSDLDQIADELRYEKDIQQNKLCSKRQEFNEKKYLIITTCLTGKGTGLFLKNWLTKELKNEQIVIETFGVFEHENMEQYIRGFEKQYNIVCIVGTVKPKIDYIPFFTIDEIFSGDRIEEIKKIYRKNKEKKWYEFDDKIVFVQKSFNNKEEIIRFLCNQMFIEAYVTEKYYKTVLERMELEPFDMLDGDEKGIAVIHSPKFDTVLKNGIGIITLKQKIQWDRVEVDVIFLLGMKDNDAEIPRGFQKNIIRNRNTMKNIRLAKSKNDLLEVLKA